MPRINIKKDKCKGCELCIKFCPHSLIIMDENLNKTGFYPADFVDKNNKCTGCAICAMMCSDVAIEVYRGI